MASVKRKRKTNSIRNLYGAIVSIKDNIKWIKEHDAKLPESFAVVTVKDIARHEKALRELQYPKNQKLGYTAKDPQWSEIVLYRAI